MIDKLKQEIAWFLERHQVGHLALSGPDGPWASVVRFISTDLTLYLIEPRASDLVFYLESNPHVVLTVSEQPADPEGGGEESVQILPLCSVQVFGSARVLAPHELSEELDKVQAAYSSKNRQAPGVYVVIEVKPRRVHRVTRDNGAIHLDTVDIEPDRQEADPQS